MIQTQTQTPSEQLDNLELNMAVHSICAVGDQAPSAEEKLKLIKQLPADQRDRALSALLNRLVEAATAAQKLDRVNRKLHGMVTELSHEPWHVAVFRSWIETGEQRLARVLCGGEERLVAVAPDTDCSELGLGETVFLSAGRNTIMAVGRQRARSGGQLGVVSEVLERGDLVVREHDLDVTLERAHWLADTEVSEGDQVIWCPRSRVVLEITRSNRVDGVRQLATELTDPPPSFAGYESIRDGAIAGFLCGLQHPATAARYGITPAQRALLLYGPPGCGKTLLARNLAHEVGARFFVIDASSIYSPWVGESEKRLLDAFRMAREQSPSILLIDEIDAIGRVRGGRTQQHADRVASVLLTQMEGAAGQSGIAVIGACNRVDLLDPALRSRFGRQFLIPAPKREAMRAIAEVHLSPELPYQDNTRPRCVDLIVEQLTSPNADNAIASLKFRDGKTRVVTARDLVSGRAVQQIVEAACEAAFRREVDHDVPGITVADVAEAVQSMINRWRSELCVTNVASYLSDLPDDVDVVSVTAVADLARPARYLSDAPATEVPA